MDYNSKVIVLVISNHSPDNSQNCTALSPITITYSNVKLPSLMSEFTYLFIFKVVLSKSMAEVVQNVIKYVRLALLTPEELKQIEQDNEKDSMVPVGRKRVKLPLLPP